MKFNEYYRWRLISDKAQADILNWMAISFFAGLVYALMSPSCPSPFSASGYDDFGQHERYLDLCGNAYAARLSALAWLVFSALRVFFLVSPWQGGPILKGSGLRVENEGGERLSLGGAARYAFFEWLPLHILGIYVLLTMDMTANLYEMGSAVTLAFAAQLIWLAPVIFRYKGKNLAEITTAARIAYDAKRAGQIEKSYQKKWRVKLSRFSVHAEKFHFLLYVPLLTFFSIQILRTPDLHPDYERHLYADREPVWEDNLYFAMEGLTAPAAVEDFYAYGRAKAIQRFMDYEALKKLAGIPYIYPIPDGGGDSLSSLDKEQELKIVKDDWKELSCLYSLSLRPDKECATRQDFESYIKANQLIWDRFNNLPAYSLYRVPPQILGSQIANPIYLAKLKAAHIVTLAEDGNPDKAFQEWIAYWPLHQSMAGSYDSMVTKAVIALSVGVHMEALEKLLYLYPELAWKFHVEIATALQAPGSDMFRVEKMFSEDISLMEPMFLGFVGNVNAIRNDLGNCIIGFEKRIQLPINEYPFGQESEICDLWAKVSEHPFIYSFSNPGYWISNLIQGLMVGGVLKGTELAESMKLWDVRLRMVRLGVEILQQDIAVNDIPAFVASASSELQNPVTEAPFKWNAQKKALFFERPGAADTIYEFRLNLARE